ncbi:HesB/IscA family protein [Stutzerimonas kirkiae]|uniref:Iron-sulfur cluster assembly accessory protein n=1 Tax=Stutzerimonas kirkiae TaxID=2211392 RepID=A0A4Q9RCR1_9GAMM|nr:iron-sulfur cluster assembly accessory protein [Stutzerimonas kirkiae]TBU98786.1 iron-sulfur cluster assembly accessory protein [Stutzerimonas kirkiae]TBV03880.1 iron-sulfur cluster assembly accessory protein [Stutzerimonas kirkiae]TBV09706.1 iron-sulfur cluster assembly accessory protein [Stutzerimonas kirkiae]TBV16760.1 iron-sulfur cluster assembly accessory protein [Stutzerimonas kirkiae]
MIILTESAKTAINRFISSTDKPTAGLRIRVEDGGCSGLKYSLKLEERDADGDLLIDCGGITVLIDDGSAPLLEGVTMDFVESMEGSGFTFVNPNASKSCSCGKSFAC